MAYKLLYKEKIQKLSSSISLAFEKEFIKGS